MYRFRKNRTECQQKDNVSWFTLSYTHKIIHSTTENSLKGVQRKKTTFRHVKQYRTSNSRISKKGAQLLISIFQPSISLLTVSVYTLPINISLQSLEIYIYIICLIGNPYHQTLENPTTEWVTQHLPSYPE